MNIAMLLALIGGFMVGYNLKAFDGLWIDKLCIVIGAILWAIGAYLGGLQA